MTDSKPAVPVHPGRRQLLLLAALFFLPVFAAILLYFVWPQLRPSGTTNYGVLLTPVQEVPEMEFTDEQGRKLGEGALKHRWSVVYMGAKACDEVCLAKLIQIRQVRLLLADERSRVQRIYIAPDAAALQKAKAQFDKEQPDLIYLADTGRAGERAADFFKPTDPNALYLVDPRGNWLMVYPAASEYKGILKDLKYLLKLSNIG
jgi:cytochrome oxidase Cu insertion factor (SCO1/SenC/PrrC family)